MTKKLVYQLCSNDPSKFNEVVFQPLCPWNCNRIKYKVKSLNTFANFLITTKDDVLKVWDDENDTEYTIKFEDISEWEDDYILDIINSNDSFPLTVSLLLGNTLKFNKKDSFADHDLFIEDSTSYRVKLLLGIWVPEIWVKHPSKNETYIPIPADGFEAPTTPMYCYNNVLYLRSIVGQQIMSRVDKANYSPPVCYRINTFLKSGLPIICNKEKFGEEVETNIEAINNVVIKLELVDFQFQPVILKSPLFICLEISPVENSMYQSNY